MPVQSRLEGALFRLALLILALLSLAACVEIPTFAIQPKVSLRLAVMNPVQAAYLSERVKSFEQNNPTIRVEVFSRMESFRGDLANGIANLVSSGGGLDAIYLTDQNFQSLGDAAVLTDLTSFIREGDDLQPPEFYPLALPVFQNRGRQMVLPAELSPLVFYYNRDLFDRASLDYPTTNWTLTDFMVAAKRLTDATGGQQNATFGFVAETTVAMWPFIFAYGGQFPDALKDPRAQTITSTETIQGMQFVVNLINRDRSYAIDPPGRTIALWYSGRAGMTTLFMSSRNSVPQQTGPANAVAPTPTPGPRPSWGFRWDVVPVPREAQRSTLVQVSGYAIPKGAAHPDQAWQLIRYLVQTLPEPGESLAYVPALKTLAQSDDFVRLYPEAGRRAYLDSIGFGQTIPRIPSSAQVTENDLRPIFRGEISVTDGLQSIRTKYANAFEKLIQ